MFIRKIRTRTTASGESYFSHRLVASQREGDRVRQKTLLNLGRHFPIDQGDWPLLCQRVDELMTHQTTLNFMTLPAEIETEARRIVKRLLERQEHRSEAPDWERVAVQSLQNSDARSVGIEHAALEALKLLDLPNQLCALGLNKRQQGCALANIIGRRTQPGSERATNAWLRTSSATGELLGIDFGALSDMALYRASDHLFKHKTALENHMFGAVETLFNLQPVVTLYDLTNTSFEGEAASQPKAKHGHSKERRSDAPLLTLGAVLDSSGFLRRTEIFPGNVVEARTLETMLTALEVPRGGIVVMDRGIATEENLAWMRAQGYIYLVVARSPTRVFDPNAAMTTVSTASKGEVTVYRDRVDSQEADATPYSEVLLRCHSHAREKKETGLVTHFTHFQDRFEQGLRDLQANLSRPRTRKTLAYIQRTIGPLRERRTP